jgi:hypothetical protein
MEASKPPTIPASVASGPKLLQFEDAIAPIFSQHCTECHGRSSPKADLDLTTLASAITGGGSGRVLIPGDAQRSRLYLLISHQESPRMPQGRDRLSDADLSTIRAWIDQGLDEGTIVRAPKPVAAPAAIPRSTKTQATPPMPVALEALGPQAHFPPLTALSLSPTAPLLAAPSASGVVLYHAMTRLPLGQLSFPFGHVEVLRFSRDGERLLIAGGVRGRRGAAQIVQVRDGQVVAKFADVGREILAADLSPLLTRIAVGGPLGRVEMLGVPSGEQLFTVDAHQDWILATAISPDGNTLASGDRSGMLVITEADTGRQLHVLREHGKAIQALRFRRDAFELASACEDGTGRLWELAEGKASRTINTNHGRGRAVDYGPAYLATGGSAGRGRLWD